jgi:hypothetical protein
MVQSQFWQIVCETLFLKIPSQRRAGGVGQGVGPEFKPQVLYTKGVCICKNMHARKNG